MNPAIASLAGKAVGLLIPFVSRTATEFVNVAGEAGYAKAKALLDRLRAKWTGDTGSTVVLENFERQPEQFRPAMEAVLQQKLAEDLELEEEVASAVRELGPIIEIIQKMDEAEHVTGLKAEEMTAGKASIVQEVNRAKNVTGAELGRIG